MAEGWQYPLSLPFLWPCHQAATRMGTGLLALLLFNNWLLLDLFKLDPPGLGWLGCDLVSLSLSALFLDSSKAEPGCTRSSPCSQCESLGDACDLKTKQPE